MEAGTQETWTTAEIAEAFGMDGKVYASLSIYTGRRFGARGGLTKGRKAGMLVADSVPELLQLVARLYEQDGGWPGIVSRIEESSA